MQSYSLYLDHQGIAPLIHHLEDVLQLAVQHHRGRYLPHELRLPIYQEFVTVLHQLYLQEGHAAPQPFQPAPPQLNLIPFTPRPEVRSMRSLQMEVGLAEWLISGGQRVIDKREIDLKYQELSRNKRVLTIEQLKDLMAKYGLKGIVIRAKGQEHRLEDTQDSSVKREEISRDEERDELEQTLRGTLAAVQPIQEESSQDEEEEEKTKRESLFDSPSYVEPYADDSLSADELNL